MTPDREARHEQWTEDGLHRYVTLRAELAALVTDRITGRFDA